MNERIDRFRNFLMGAKKSYQLMNKDSVILEFQVDRATESIEDVKWVGRSRKPIGFTDLGSFLAARKAPSNRSHIQQVLAACGADTFSGYLDVVHALSVNDTFWVRRKHEPVVWKDANLYTNELNEALSRIAFEGGLVGQSLDLSSPTAEASLGGSFAKCVIRRHGTLSILKAPMTPDGGEAAGAPCAWHPWSEVMASQVAAALGIDCVEYTLVQRRSRKTGKTVPATTCPLFTSAKEGFVPARLWLGMGDADYATLLDAYKGIGSEQEFRQMVVLDALTMNPDRHMGNHGVLFDTDSLEPIRMAPVFDNNLAFYPSRLCNDADEFYKAAREELRPAIGGDFLLVAREAMDGGLRKRVGGLAGFKFDRSALKGMPDERIDAMEKVVGMQVAALASKSAVGGFNLARQRDLDLSWQIEGWPDDDDDPAGGGAALEGIESVAEAEQKGKGVKGKDESTFG